MKTLHTEHVGRKVCVYFLCEGTKPRKLGFLSIFFFFGMQFISLSEDRRRHRKAEAKAAERVRERDEDLEWISDAPGNRY